MSINIGIGSDPGSQGTQNLEAFGAVAPVAPTSGEAATTDIMQLSSLAQSESTLQAVAPNAGNPTLSANVAATLLAFDLLNQQAAVSQAILDNWTKQIQVQAQLSAENNIRNIILQDTLQQQRLQSDIENENVKENLVNAQAGASTNASSATNFNEWWNSASGVDKSNYLDTNGDRMIGAYLDTHNDAAIQNSDLAKGGLPAFIETMKETLVVNPMAVELTMRTSDMMSGQSSLTSELLGITLPPSINDIPQINLFLPITMYNSAVGATLGLYGKYGAAGEVDEKSIDEQFVKELAKKTLKNIENTAGWLFNKQPGFGQLSQDQQQSIVFAANLLALTTVLIFDVKAQGAASNLSPEEYASMLKNGNPDEPILNAVLGRINLMFAELDKKKPDEAQAYKDFVNNFIVAAQLHRFNIDDLRDFSKVLLYANNTVSEAERVLKRSA